MTTFTFSFARRIVRVRLISALAMLTAVGLALAWIMASADSGRSAAEEIAAARKAAAVRDAAAAAGVAATLGRSGRELLSALHVNFDLATRGADPQKSSMTAMPRDNAAGITCNPAALDRGTATVRMILPASFDARNTALVALAPDGRLRIVYLSYGPDIDPEDLIIPSRSIDWERARIRNDFIVDVRNFGALHPGKDFPEPLFRQAGVYQFALINDVDRDDDATDFVVAAGCVVRWQP